MQLEAPEKAEGLVRAEELLRGCLWTVPLESDTPQGELLWRCDQFLVRPKLMHCTTI